MEARTYPRLVVDVRRIVENYLEMKRLCAVHGVGVTAVIKGVNGRTEIVKALSDAGADTFATSRLVQIERLKRSGISAKWMLIRIPQLCECADTVRLCDMSLQSGIETVREIERECERQGKTHNILMMLDLGDLREGYFSEEELLRDCAEIKESCPRVKIIGTATLMSDMSGVVADSENMGRLVSISKKLEELLGYPLEYVSGGSTLSYPALCRGEMPQGINNLRIGEGILLAHDLRNEWSVGGLENIKTPMKVQAQIIELRRKPSAPQGRCYINGFGESPDFTDRGERLRAIVALGRLDIGDPMKLIPLEKGAELIGGTSDHTVLDVEDCERKLGIGDVLEFELCYEGMMYATASENMNIIFV